MKDNEEGETSVRSSNNHHSASDVSVAFRAREASPKPREENVSIYTQPPTNRPSCKLNEKLLISRAKDRKQRRTILQVRRENKGSSTQTTTQQRTFSFIRNLANFYSKVKKDEIN
jgi:hypothetical protein